MKEEFATNIESVENEKISKALKQLGRVEAPGDFDVRVRSRIAAHRTENKVSGGWFFPRLMIPAAMAVLILGIFAIYYNSGENEQLAVHNAPQIERTENITETPSLQNINDPITTAEVEFDQKNEIAATSSAVQKQEPANKPALRNAERNVRNASSIKTNVEVSDTNSTDFMLRPPEKVINIGEMANGSATSNVSANDALKKIGINAVSKDGAWHVTSISAESSAVRSGLNVGDMIESIDGRKPASSPLFTSDHKIKALVIKNNDGTFRVVRID